MTLAPSETADASVPTDARPLTDVTFANLDLHPLLQQGLEEAGFHRCTPIQALTLPLALKGRDVAGQAQTGTGKTLAFLVTIINRLLTQAPHVARGSNDPRAVVLAPTRELAIQIQKDADKISAHTGLRFALIYGGVDYDKQREMLKRGVDVIIATPGRLIDYAKQHAVDLRGVDIVVLDEADRMFDLGFIKDIRFLLRRMPAREERQSMLYSATLSHRVLELAYEHMNEPEKLTVETEFITAAKVRQQVFFPSNEEKLPLLLGLLSRMDASRTMVFVNTKAWVERVARALEKNHYRVGVLSGDVPQPKREKLLAKFTKGDLDILVATDVAARGLHIPNVSHVFNYDLPFDAEDYVHRIGRTARLGAEGDAVSFACELYAISLPDIEKYIDQKLPVTPIDPELLKPVQRTPRAPVEGEDKEDSLAQVFDEARAERKRQDERSGKAPRGGSRDGRGPRAGGPRSGSGDRPRSDRPRPDRPRAEPEAAGAEGGASATAPAERAPRPRTDRPVREAGESRVPSHLNEDGTPRLGPDGKPLKKRRRRGGRGRRRPEDGAAPVEGGAQRAPRDPNAPREGGPRPPRDHNRPPRPHHGPAKSPSPKSGKAPGIIAKVGKFFSGLFGKR